MARQKICFVRRGAKSPRLLHVLVLFLSVQFSAISGTASASPKFTKPTQDVIDLCTWSLADRASVAEEFTQRGWKTFRAPYPEALASLLADGGLFRALIDERYNFFGLDTETGIIPDMIEHLDTISDVSQRGVYDAFWWDGDTRAFLMIHDKGGNRKLGEDLGCRFFSSSLQDATLVSDAVHQYPGDGHKISLGPARTVSATTIGDELHKPLSGAASFLVKLGVFVDRPILEPQVGMGPARVDFFWFEQSEFEEQYSRKPNSAFGLEIYRRNKEAKQ